jgi:hypothetical protein
MDSSDPRSDSPVDVEIQEALQIISLAEEKEGNDMLFKFHLQEDNLKRVLNKIPKDMKVAVVSKHLEHFFRMTTLIKTSNPHHNTTLLGILCRLSLSTLLMSLFRIVRLFHIVMVTIHATVE